LACPPYNSSLATFQNVLVDGRGLSHHGITLYRRFTVDLARDGRKKLYVLAINARPCCMYVCVSSQTRNITSAGFEPRRKQRPTSSIQYWLVIRSLDNLGVDGDNRFAGAPGSRLSSMNSQPTAYACTYILIYLHTYV